MYKRLRYAGMRYRLYTNQLLNYEGKWIKVSVKSKLGRFVGLDRVNIERGFTMINEERINVYRTDKDAIWRVQS